MFHINIQCRLLVKHGVKTLHITAAVLIRPLGLDVKEVLGGRSCWADRSGPTESCPWIWFWEPKNQTHKPVAWALITDSPPPTRMILGRTHIRTLAPLGSATRQCLLTPQVKWNVHILLSLLTRAAFFFSPLIVCVKVPVEDGVKMYCRCKRSANRVRG